jgi:hypothetical protein
MQQGRWKGLIITGFCVILATKGVSSARCGALWREPGGGAVVTGTLTPAAKEAVRLLSAGDCLGGFGLLVGCALAVLKFASFTY